MGKEIERKFLFNEAVTAPFTLDNPVKIKQGYIFTEQGKHLRIRLYHDKAVIGLKFTGSQIRDEYEYEIPLAEGKEIYDKCTAKVEKIRFILIHNGETFDIDMYPNKLQVVEIEFESKEEADAWVKPDWLGEEISGNRNYSNILLAEQNLKF